MSMAVHVKQLAFHPHNNDANIWCAWFWRRCVWVQ